MNSNRHRNGQAVLEYVLVFAAMLFIVGAVTYLSRAVRRSSDRSTVLVASEYP